MRVPDVVLTSVGFVCEVTHRDASGAASLDPCGSGFCAVMPYGGGFFHFFVTARHVLESLQGREVRILVNKKGGGVTAIEPYWHWWRHPSDNTCDAAVLIFNADPSLNIKSVPASMFLRPDDMSRLTIGVGDEVFTTGLFTFAPGEDENMPIVRHGNVAMLPRQQIQTDYGFADVYLVEARSIGGLSGSPVFVRETVYAQTKTHDGRDVVMHGLGEFYLLGVMHGHWDIKITDEQLFRGTWRNRRSQPRHWYCDACA